MRDVQTWERSRGGLPAPEGDSASATVRSPRQSPLLFLRMGSGMKVTEWFHVEVVTVEAAVRRYCPVPSPLCP